jgi:uncharacterized membrane protein YcaP (DUF421 family)
MHTIFGAKDSVGAGQEAARAVIVFLAGWGMIRLFGRRAFGRWSALDIVVAIVVGSNLSRTLTGSAPLGGTLLATFVLFGLHQLTALAAAAHPKISKFFEGRAMTLGEGGKLDPSELKRHAISDADINEALRQNGIADPAKTRLVMLEPSGKITIVKAGD